MDQKMKQKIPLNYYTRIIESNLDDSIVVIFYRKNISKIYSRTVKTIRIIEQLMEVDNQNSFRNVYHNETNSTMKKAMINSTP